MLALYLGKDDITLFSRLLLKTLTVVWPRTSLIFSPQETSLLCGGFCAHLHFETSLRRQAYPFRVRCVHSVFVSEMWSNRGSKASSDNAVGCEGIS